MSAVFWKGSLYVYTVLSKRTPLLTQKFGGDLMLRVEVRGNYLEIYS